MDYQFTPLALSDLLQIRRFTVEQWGVQQANIYGERIKTTLDLIRTFPYSGQLKPELGQGIYGYSIENHVIIYEIKPTMILVLGVVHQRMLPRHLFDANSSIDNNENNND